MVKVNQVMALNQILKSFFGNLHVENILSKKTKIILFKQFRNILLLPSTRKVMIMLFGLEFKLGVSLLYAISG